MEFHFPVVNIKNKSFPGKFVFTSTSSFSHYTSGLIGYLTVGFVIVVCALMII